MSRPAGWANPMLGRPCLQEIYGVNKMGLANDHRFTWCAEFTFRRLVMDHGMEALVALAPSVVVHLHAQRVSIAVGTSLGVEALLPQFLGWN